ncbi:hypothetical protein AB0M43_33905 [Longispora sp. NPDC051575]|uniref:hypothetical protein n=1 Tax=Longispora sp. NPDC051575 TaxID=3154943 RepID=UPI0034302100
MKAQLRTLGAVASGLLLAMSLTTPAHAVTDHPVTNSPRWLECPAGTTSTGSLTTYWSGTATPCVTPRPNEVFALVGYNPQYAYGQPFAFTPSGAFATGFTPKPGTTAVCLVVQGNIRLDCVDYNTGAHISVNDPRVQGGGGVEGIDFPPDPDCVDCFGDSGGDDNAND